MKPLSALALFAVLAVASAEAHDFQGPQLCSNMHYENAPHTPEYVLLIPYVDYRKQTSWLYTTARTTAPLIGKEKFVAGNLEVFDIEKMQSHNSRARAEEWETNEFAFWLPEFDVSVVTFFECEDVGSRAKMAEELSSGLDSVERAKVEQLFRNVAENYGAEPRQ